MALHLAAGKRRTNAVGKNTAVFGIYKTRISAEKAVDNLLSAGFPSGDVSVLLPDIETSKDLTHEKNTKAPEGAATGVAAGGAAGGAFGLLVSLGALAIPGLGTVPGRMPPSSAPTIPPTAPPNPSPASAATIGPAAQADFYFSSALLRSSLKKLPHRAA
jgi:hypothetical protein